MQFDGNRAYQYAQKIAYPRLAGREGERRAANYLTETFKSLGYDVAAQPFPILRTPWGWLRMGLVTTVILLMGAGILSNRSHYLAAACCGMVFVVMAVMEYMWRWFAEREASSYKDHMVSSNIIARRPPSDHRHRPAALTLYLTAHHDSKGQSLSLTWRILLITTVLCACLFFGLHQLILALYPAFIQWPGSSFISTIILGIWLLGIFAALILLGTRTDNRSSGALDNAGSVGVLMALAEALRHEDFQQTDVVFISTGAEELGLLGSHAFLREWQKNPPPNQSWFLNFDLLGVPGVLRILEGARLLHRPLSRYARLTRQVAEQQGIPLHPQPILPGALLDHIPFSRRGLQATSLISVSRQTRLVHTEKDTMELVDPRGLAEAGNLVIGVIQALEEDQNSKI